MSAIGAMRLLEILFSKIYIPHELSRYEVIVHGESLCLNGSLYNFIFGQAGERGILHTKIYNRMFLKV